MIIKKYKNRKLYSPESSQYVTLNDIQQFVKDKKDFKVVDTKGNDITAETLIQSLSVNRNIYSNLNKIKELIINT